MTIKEYVNGSARRLVFLDSSLPLEDRLETKQVTSQHLYLAWLSSAHACQGSGHSNFQERKRNYKFVFRIALESIKLAIINGLPPREKHVDSSRQPLHSNNTNDVEKKTKEKIHPTLHPTEAI